MDSHKIEHIAHKLFWKKGTNPPEVIEHPEIFTLISHQEVLKGNWVPVNEKYKVRF